MTKEEKEEMKEKEECWEIAGEMLAALKIRAENCISGRKTFFITEILIAQLLQNFLAVKDPKTAYHVLDMIKSSDVVDYLIKMGWK